MDEANVAGLGMSEDVRKCVDAPCGPLRVDTVSSTCAIFNEMSQYEDFPSQTQEIPEHYPYVTRRVMHLLEEGQLTNVTDVDVEPDYGYVTRINYNDGTHRITYGNDLGLNTGAACDLAKDKGHSKFMLRTIGVECPEGEEFLLPEWAVPGQRR